MTDNLEESKDDLFEEFLDYYKDSKLPNPDIYPIQYEFMVKMFLNSKREEKQEVTDVAKQ